ncbi:uncharacterized protein F4812DRAFT_464149 [Daldinia caldariorum]|uniref:uncharacterized protein n=1 Tax=Daldinia caldariorum TaxID=326644 RepID=UPI002008C8CD|nr:uncharacterized protein F4812DRAFT_464149 [Daldinia caldariorum]KAI1463033.1 hypothetical protein F4812DRAFT_464149 [Daldinia caldariorum]
MVTDSQEASDATIRCIQKLVSFLETLDDSSEKHDENVVKFKSLLGSLPPDQINAHENNWLEETILHVAARQGLVWAAEILLEANASVSEQDCVGRQPLHAGCLGGNPSLVRLLLKSGASILATDRGRNLPFHVAASAGHTDILKIFLETDRKPAIDVNTPGKWKMTALHCAAWNGHEKSIEVLLDAGAEVDLQDTDGWTPLMAAKQRNYIPSMCILLDKKGYDQANIRDKEGKTPLLAAIEENNSKVVDMLLERWPNENKRDPNVYQRLLLYEAPTHEEGVLKMQNTILEALRQDTDSYDGALSWAATKFERHRIAEKLLIQSPYPEVSKASAIELATQQKKPDILWWLVATSPRNPEIMSNIKEARDIAEASKNAPQGMGKDENKKLEDKKRNQSKSGEDTDATAAHASGNGSSDWVYIIDILQYPPIAQKYDDITVLNPPELEPKHGNVVNEQEATITRFYKAEKVSSIIQRTRYLKDVIYEEGPMSIMAGAISDLEEIMNKRSENMEERSSSRRLRAIYEESNIAFTYIHLPATNIDWMKDLLLKIMADENLKNGGARHREISSFLQSTWFEIPDQTSESRFMRPQFVERRRIASTNKKQSEEQRGSDTNNAQHSEAQDIANQKTNDHTANSQAASEQEIPKKEDGKEEGQEGEEEEEEGLFISSSALYMPFLSFATQREMNECNDNARMTESKNQTILQKSSNKNPEIRMSMEQKLSELNKSYKDSVLHNSATLDEAYYHFDLKDEETLSERNRRNRNQVVTKQLHPGLKGSQKETWSLLRVNQIWIWTLDEKWVISATSHPVNDIEQSWLDGFTEHLNKRIEAGGAQSQPGSVEEIVKAMVNYCIGFYERRRTFRDSENGWKTELSIRQLFSNYINKIGREETNLFTKFQDLRNVSDTPGHESEPQKPPPEAQRLAKFKEATSKAHLLFGEIKDILDELGVIKSIINYQINVQEKLFKNEPNHFGLTSSHFLDDITEMESRANKIQSAVNSTLTLLHSEIANFQAEESVRQGKEAVKQTVESVNQGKFMVVFTITTAVFLPLSFLTSLFAVDSDKLNGTPAWVFGVIFGVSFAFTALALCIPFLISLISPVTKPAWGHIKKRYGRPIKERYNKCISMYSKYMDEHFGPLKDEERNGGRIAPNGPDESVPCRTESCNPMVSPSPWAVLWCL